jgi:hypothetical protein
MVWECLNKDNVMGVKEYPSHFISAAPSLAIGSIAHEKALHDFGPNFIWSLVGIWAKQRALKMWMWERSGWTLWSIS